MPQLQMKTPSVKSASSLVIKGIVEGFYGPPYRWPDRFFLIKNFKELGFNYYLYGPKQDPYHRRDWQKLYPKRTLNMFERLHRKCQRLNIRFNYALTPGGDLGLIIKKFGQMRGVGIEEFALFFDDLKVKITKDLAAQQAVIANSVAEKLKPKKLFFCPTQYSGKSSPYLITLAKVLDRQIYVLWTGPKIVSRRIDRDNLLWLINLFGKRIVLWDNYPVNDYDRSRIFLGPFRGRDPRILKNLTGYLANPMNEARISLIPLFTLAEFFKEGSAYHPKESIDRSLKRFGLKENRSMIQQFYPSRIFPRMSYETRLLKNGYWDKLLPIIEGWSHFKCFDGHQAIDNLLTARDLLIAGIRGRRPNKKKVASVEVSRDKDFYFENQAVDFLLTKRA